jgi:transposase InsO family protein
MVAFIDDRSRYILAWQFQQTRSSTETNECLLKAIAECIRLGSTSFGVLHTDNGTEFKGDFLATLRLEGIILSNSRPYTPTDNAKIERAWKTIDDYCESYDYSNVAEIVNEMNTTWTHRSTGCVPFD